MFKSILVPLGGGETDGTVLDTALTVAQLGAAHIDCFHNFIDSAEAAASSKQVPYLIGGALTKALEQLEAQGRQRAASALRHYTEFCRLDSIARPDAGTGLVSASMVEGRGKPDDNLVFQARHHDLVVMARPRASDNLPADTLPRMLLEGGQPILLVPEYFSTGLLDTVAVCWKDTASCARALVAALPLLTKARRVLLLSLDEGQANVAASVEAARQHLSLHGIFAEAVSDAAGSRPVADALVRCALARHVDLLVMGSYSHGPLRELLLGSCTQGMLTRADLPVLMVH